MSLDAARSFTHTLTLYRSLPSSTSPIICALYLYVLASSSSAPVLTRPVLRMRAHAIWSSATRVDKKDEVILSSTIENVYAALPNIALTEGLNIVDAIAECLIKRELGDILGSWFVREVNSSNSKGKQSQRNRQRIWSYCLRLRSIWGADCCVGSECRAYQ